MLFTIILSSKHPSNVGTSSDYSLYTYRGTLAFFISDKADNSPWEVVGSLLVALALSIFGFLSCLRISVSASLAFKIF